MNKKTCLFIAFMVLLSFMLTACSASKETPEQAVTNALNAVKNFDKDTAQKYLAYDKLFTDSSDSEADDLIKDEENLKLLVNKLSFKIISSIQEGDTATVKTEITNIDMAAIMGEYFQKAIALAFENAFGGADAKSEEEMEAQAEQIFVDLMKRENNKMRVSTIDIKLTRNENSWKIDTNEEFQDAISGGLFKAIKEIENSFGSSDTSEDKLREINNFIITDIWNKGFCDISHYLEDGKSSTGETMDIDFTLEQLADAMNKKAEYDTFINSLEDEKYAKIKQIWNKLSPEIDRLYAQVQEKKPTANDTSYDFDTGLFTQYRDAFSDEVENLQ